MYIVFFLTIHFVPCFPVSNSKRNIPWENVIAFNSDNASVMKGRHNSVISRIKASQPNIQDLGCICRLVQLATGCGMKAAKVPVEEILVGIYTHFDKR